MRGTVIGQYRIVGQVGRGTAGTVYKAIDESLNREVAIKILNPDVAGTEVMKRFRTEATALARLNHPAIATIHQLFKSGGDLLMVMEFVRGETLENLSRRLGALSPERAAYVIDQLLWGVGHAHAAGIVHRDLKPANVMLTAAGAVKIMDFGIARVRGTEHVTGDGCMLGTPAYMAPEQILGTAVDGRADLYSIGVIFYRLLTGLLPFRVETPIQMLQRQLAETPEPLRTHREDLPDWCEAIVRRALAKSADDRFQTADEFRAALAHGARILTRTDLAADLAQPIDDSSESAPLPLAVPTGSWAADGGTLVLNKSLRLTRGVAAAVVVAMLGVAAFWRFGTPSSSPAPAPAIASAPDPSTDAPSTAVAQAAATPAPASGPPPVSQPPSSIPASAAAVRPTAPPATTSPAAAAGATQTPAARPVAVAAAIQPADSAEKPEKPAAKLATVVFETKALVANGKNHKEHDATVALVDGKIRVATDDEGRQRVVHSVPYENVTSISYSRGRDPLWMSPDGPETVARVGGGAFGMFRRDRHWITVQTNTTQRFVILRASEATAGKVLAALEARTGQRAHVVSTRKKS